MAGHKVNFYNDVIDAVTAFDSARDTLVELREKFYATGYNSGGANEIVAGDISGNDLIEPRTVADLTSIITMIENLTDFLGNVAPVQGDRDTIIAKFKK